MPLWKPGKAPEIYPLSFRQALEREGTHVIAVRETAKAAEYERKRFSALRMNVREKPLHPLFPKLEAFRTKTFVRESPEGLFEVVVETRESFLRTISEQFGELL